MASRFQDVILRGTRADQPDPEDVSPGTLYYVTDEGVTERAADDNLSWEDYSDGGSAGITALTGEVTATGPGSVPATITNLAVSTAKIAALAVTDAKLAANSVITTKILDANVTKAKIEDSVALSVIGRAGNTTGVVADIVAGSDAEVLRRSGTSIGFGTIATDGITDGAVTDAKLRDSAALSVIGRSANSSGDPADITAATDHQVLRRSGTALEFGAVDLAQSAAVAGLLALANGGLGVDISGAPLPLGFGQIQFPASQNPSGAANILDDYDINTFNPTIGGSGGQSGQVYSSQVGTYVKIGQLVIASFAVTLSTLGTITGTVQIQSLPFSSQNLAGARFVCPIFWVNTTTAYVLVQGVMLENVNAINLNGATAATTNMAGTTLAQADLTNTSRFVGTIVYRSLN